ncbi:MAG: YARHG domain-containing protein [Agriterribacter sp.]
MNQHSVWRSTIQCILILITAIISPKAWANDGSFFAKGNQLIPITETNITVKKEILTLKKIRDQFIEVTVYYEFFNPGEQKNLTVGFEAFSPQGDVNGTPKNGQHPYMRDFTVELNNKILTYNIAYVQDSLYAKSGIIKSKRLDEIKNNIQDEQVVDFFYVYHFNANFKKGLNIIKHTYNYDVSTSIAAYYYFEYVLTAANRWGNKQIDDFTLEIDMGECETFSIEKSFFTNAGQWLINGIGKSTDIKQVDEAFGGVAALQFYIQKGNIIFQKKNFKPTGDLFLFCRSSYDLGSSALPFSYYQDKYIGEPKNELEKKAWKNLPFARRGYIFQNADLQKYFEQIDWYIPNPNYKPDVGILTDEEKKWLEKWK